MNMSKENLHLTWIISLIVTALATFLLAGSELFEFDLSDTFQRIVGVFDLIAVPVLAWSTVQKTRAVK